MTGDRRTELREANTIFKRRATLSAAKRTEAILLLISHGIWSRRNIASITGATMWEIAKLSDKSDKTGARLNPESLETILQIIKLKDKSETDSTLYVKVVIEQGTSVYFLAEVIGEPVSNVKRRAGMFRKEAA